jgi:hypothetical protein
MLPNTAKRGAYVNSIARRIGDERDFEGKGELERDISPSIYILCPQASFWLGLP